MKKTLIIGVLVLLIVSSMVAGTLAVYSKTIDLGGNAAAKRFYIGANEDPTSIDLKLAPGGSADYKFEVTNKDGNTVTEVAMDLKIVATIPVNFDGLKVTLQLGGETIQGIVADNKATFEIDNWSAANVETEQIGILTYTWVDNGDNQIGQESSNQDFTVTVTGTQHGA